MKKIILTLAAAFGIATGALAAGGEAVVARQLALLRDGVDRTLALLVVPRLDDVGPAVLAPSPVAPNDRLVDTSAPR